MSHLRAVVGGAGSTGLGHALTRCQEVPHYECKGEGGLRFWRLRCRLGQAGFGMQGIKSSGWLLRALGFQICRVADWGD